MRYPRVPAPTSQEPGAERDLSIGAVTNRCSISLREMTCRLLAWAAESPHELLIRSMGCSCPALGLWPQQKLPPSPASTLSVSAGHLVSRGPFPGPRRDRKSVPLLESIPESP